MRNKTMGHPDKAGTHQESTPPNRRRCPNNATLDEALNWYTQRVHVTETGCYEFIGSRDKDGYPVARTIKLGKLRLHRHVLMRKLGRQLTENECALHACDNPPCIRSAHLFAGTFADNAKDRDKKNRQQRGTTHGRTHLTDEDVLAIRADTRSQVAIAKDYGITSPTVSAIKLGHTWKHLPLKSHRNPIGAPVKHGRYATAKSQ